MFLITVYKNKTKNNSEYMKNESLRIFLRAYKLLQICLFDQILMLESRI